MSGNSFGARSTLTVGDQTYGIYRLDAVETDERLPYSLKVLLENLLRNEDGRLVTAGQVSALASWSPRNREEEYSITGLEGGDPGAEFPTEVTVRADHHGQVQEFPATVRIDTPAEAEYFRHGGILQYVLRRLLVT